MTIFVVLQHPRKHHFQGGSLAMLLDSGAPGMTGWAADQQLVSEEGVGDQGATGMELDPAEHTLSPSSPSTHIQSLRLHKHITSPLSIPRHTLATKQHSWDARVAAAFLWGGLHRAQDHAGTPPPASPLLAVTAARGVCAHTLYPHHSSYDDKDTHCVLWGSSWPHTLRDASLVPHCFQSHAPAVLLGSQRQFWRQGWVFVMCAEAGG